MEFKRLKTEKLSGKVIKEFEFMLEKGILKPGDRIPSEMELAEQFGMSRGILREALRTMESFGYISRKPKGGTFIRELAVKEFKGHKLMESLKHATYIDLLEVRETMEQKIVELAVERASEEDITEIERIFESCKVSGNYNSTLDQKFHLSIASTTKNAIMINFMVAQLDLMNDISIRTSCDNERVLQILEEHKNILDSIKERNAEKAKKAVLNHLNNIRKSIEKSFEKNDNPI